jgi:hypothetical protein
VPGSQLPDPLNEAEGPAISRNPASLKVYEALEYYSQLPEAERDAALANENRQAVLKEFGKGAPDARASAKASSKSGSK